MTEQSPSPGPDDAGSAAPDTPEARVKHLIERIRPFLQQDGGDVEYVGFEGGTVRVRLQGACSSCPSSTYTLKLGIENALKQQVPEVNEVVTVP